MTHHSIDDVTDIVYRLEYASLSTPEVSLLREAAAYIRELREEAADNSIVLIEEKTGEEIAVIDGELAESVHKQAVTEFLTNLFKRMIEEHESRERPD